MNRANSQGFDNHLKSSVAIPPDQSRQLRRRTSIDEKSSHPRQFLVDVEHTKEQLLIQEDTNGDSQVTIHDSGPKVMKLGSVSSGGVVRYDTVRGTYMISNLLQELALASDNRLSRIVLHETRLNEPPVDRLSRIIREVFWQGLTRRIDAEGLELTLLDPKNRSNSSVARIYVPFDDHEAFDYYVHLASSRLHLALEVVRLPEKITPEYVKSINDKPGLLSLAMRTEKDINGNLKKRGNPFVVPGGRFNEMYGWDSYFEALGLLKDGFVDLARSMVENFCYEIKYYGKILNANRTYYLTRSQPPFLTDMALSVFSHLPETESSKEWLKNAISAAIKEYHQVWMSKPRLTDTGLSRYYCEGLGMPPETEPSHFNVILAEYAERRGLDINTYSVLYNNGSIDEPALDEYFIHDRAVRESANCIEQFFGGELDGQESQWYFDQSEKRKSLMNELMWNKEKGMFFDYDFVNQKMIDYESVTTCWPLFAEMASNEQAQLIRDNLARLFEVEGGLVSGTFELIRQPKEPKSHVDLFICQDLIVNGKACRANSDTRDYPFGWAPHQILAWDGLSKYGYDQDAERLAYRWCFMITKSFVDYNGVVPEKYDVVTMNHNVTVEYGNVGTGFKYVPREGFGWMNASYQLGLGYLSMKSRRSLGALIPPNKLFKK